MQKEGKVVPLAAAIDRGGRTPLPCLPVLLLQVRDKAALQLRQGLQALFDNADDTLFEMADKAVDRCDQNLYFEAMRDLRLKRKSIERGFLDTFYDAYARIGQVDLLAQLAEAGNLRSKVQLERAAAIEGMVARVLSRDGIALQQLGLRLQALLDRPVHEQRNPLGPAALCGYFLEAGRNLGVGLRVKLVLLKLFERYVLRDVDVIYAEANQLLAVAGVLPELQPAPRRRAEDRRMRQDEGRQAKARKWGRMRQARPSLPRCKPCWPRRAGSSHRDCRRWLRPSRSAPLTWSACFRICSTTCRLPASLMISNSANNSNNCCCGSACAVARAGASP